MSYDEGNDQRIIPFARDLLEKVAPIMRPHEPLFEYLQANLPELTGDERDAWMVLFDLSAAHRWAMDVMRQAEA